jgi:hypothetical protein
MPYFVQFHHARMHLSDRGNYSWYAVQLAYPACIVSMEHISKIELLLVRCVSHHVIVKEVLA